MDANEATTIVLSKIKGIDPDNASKIMGYLLIQDLTEKDLIRLAFGPETLLHGLILKAKSQLGLHSPSPRTSQRSDLDPVLSPFSNIVVRHGAASPSSLCFSSGGAGGGSRAGSKFFAPPFNAGRGGPGDLGEDSKYFSFINDDGGKSGEGVEMDGHYLHKRSYSESDVGFGYEDSGGENSGGGGCCRPCLYFSRGLCKNGSNCKFLHGHGGSCRGDDLEGGGYSTPVPFAGSPGGFDHEELMRLKVAHQKRLAVAAASAAAQFVPGMSPPSPQGKYVNMLLQQQQNNAHRFLGPGMAAGDDFYKYGRCQPERGDFLAMGLVDKVNSASRQIYLTFPADSAFKDEDVSEYFSKYGPVQDVRIPYQQKRMFGFVTFVYPETVKLILAKGNPHFICDSRVLVKPYKDKGKVSEKRQLQPLQQLFERGDFSPSSLFPPLDPEEPYDHLGARGFHNSHEMMLRRKFESQANLQQAIEMHGRRLLNLQLPDLKDDGMYHHMRSLSLSSPVSPSINPRGQFSPTVMPFNVFNRDAPEDCWNRPAILVSSAAEEHPRNHVNVTASDNILADERNGDNPSLRLCDSQGSFDHVLPDSLFASPTKSSADHHSDFSKPAAADLIEKTGATEIHDAPVTPTTNNSSSGNRPLSSNLSKKKKSLCPRTDGFYQS